VTVGEAGADQRTPDIASVIQEIVDRPGWSSGNSLVIIITGTGKRTAEAYDGIAAAAPLLHVGYYAGPSNDPPVAVDDAYSTDEETPLSVAAPGVLDNDSDADGEALTAILVSDVSNGTLTLNLDGSFDYTPDPDYSGPDSFTYVANDGTVDSNTTSVDITVIAVNDAPVADDQTVATDEDTTVPITLTASDADSDPLTFDLVTSPTNGTLSGSARDLTYTPDAEYSGPDRFSFSANDGTVDSNTAAVDITVHAVNDPPVAAGDAYSVDEDGSLTVVAPGVLENDTDAEGEPLTSALVSDVSNGTLTLNLDGSFEYTPDPDYSGPDSFTYAANDGSGDSNVATVTIAVNTVHDPPVATDDTGSVTEGGTLNQAAPGVLSNDSDPENDPPTVTTTPVLPSTNGSLTLNADGSYTYTPDSGFNGDDSFVYEVCGAEPLCDTATVAITANPSVPVTVELRVAARSDDAGEQAEGRVTLNSSDLELVVERTIQTVGVRFNGVTIPQGATIVNAYIQFQVDERTTAATALTVHGEAHDNAPTFVNIRRNISSRTRTNAAVLWVPVPWETVGAAGPDQQTPDIAQVIQEIVSWPGWTSGNSLVIIITGTGKRVAESFNGDQAGAPLLHVEYYDTGS
jgi:VCBS repeat-containing protein